MNPRLAALFSAVLLVVSSPTAPAQTGNASGQSPAAAADAEWARLAQTPRAVLPAAAAAPDAAGAAAARSQLIALTLAEADAFRSFRQKNPQHTAATEAKLREADALLRAKALGEVANDARRTALIGQIRRDASIAVAKRAPIAAFSDNLDVLRVRGLDADGRLRAHEEVARSLNREFPSMPDGFRSLLQIARRSPDERAKAIASELAAAQQAPADVRREASVLVARHALVGRKLAEAGGTVLGAYAPLASRGGGPVAIYTWASFEPASLALAEKLSRLAPQGLRVVGVCLDQRDLAPARQLAQTRRLPGELVFDWLGRKGEVAEQLALDLPGLVLLADASGRIRTVSAQRDLAAALAALTQP